MTQHDEASDWPAIALITNHGYAGVEIPFGGAPDTGGQNKYVNTLALTLEGLGYAVTIFARGGFPHYESDRLREGIEHLSEHVRYVYVPGGGDRFIRKEEIAVALDEELDWLASFIETKAAGGGGERARDPWAVYEIVNTHYWDAAVLGVGLVQRWRDDAAWCVVERICKGAVDQQHLDELGRDRHWRSLGAAPAHQIGRVLLAGVGCPGAGLWDRVREAAGRFAQVHDLDAADVVRRVGRVEGGALAELAAADALGRAVLAMLPDEQATLDRDLRAADRHVWTPHSLGVLKAENFKDRPPEVVRALRFCERRSHERMVCGATRAFAATSNEIAERLRSDFGVATDRIFYFPPCVDAGVFRPRDEAELGDAYRYLAEVSGVDEQVLRRSRIVFETSRMDRTKRKDLLIEAFADVAGRHDDAYLFIGGGPDNELFRELAALRDSTPGLTGRAFLTGFIPEEHIGPLLALADVYVSPSEMEGFGMSVLQAAASGTAVVASDLTPFAVQYVPDDALVVDAGDVGGFADAINRLLDNENDRRDRARRLLEKARGLDWPAQARGFLDHLRQHGFTIAHGEDHP
jgi:glycosyltransferase involved in cell wall biosynthesis